ncbi:glycosyltransferase [Actinocrispum wychmicini]|uniref:Glycosyl transferase family 2 n=1 Tax=Actinocrispum wychmicini TaxID=1213861 RepID=A0A4R2JP02_9PSEU|nr:glycosyltransferase [Actinocrispum wychmicini]TCO60472.1 glycosyl transferase family 2 [Actinocrispum wychmicini]
MTVDIMLPAYGDGRLLRETVESVLAQRDPDWRLTVIDDGVDQGLGGDLEQWLAGHDDPRVTYLANPVRLGINRNFQRCVDTAREDLVTLLGSDDRLLPHFVGRVHEWAKEFPEAAFVHTNATVIDEDGNPALPLADRVKRMTMPRVRGQRVIGGEDLAVSLLRGNWMYFPSVVFRRDVIQQHGFREGFDIVQDLDLYLRILLDGGRAVLLERPCIEYRRHAASVSSAQAGDGTRFDEERAYFNEMADMMSRAGWPRAARSARLHWTSRVHSLVTIPGLLAAGNRRAAATMLKTTFSYK